jgi:hypothetical protein
MAGAVGFLADLNDQWLKPRLLRVVVSEQLPQPGSTVPPSELASILDAVRTHGLLTEAVQGPPDRKLAEAWRAAVDAWIQRVGELLQSDSVCCLPSLVHLHPTPLLIWSNLGPSANSCSKDLGDFSSLCHNTQLVLHLHQTHCSKVCSFELLVAVHH